MTDKPSLTQAPAIASLAGQEYGPKPSYGSATAKLAIKHPHFAVTPGKMWTAFLYRWKTASFVALVFAAIGAGIAWMTYKPKYTAVTLMRVSPNTAHILPNAAADRTSSRDMDFQKTQTQLVKGRPVINDVLKDGQVAGLPTIRGLESPQLWLEKELQASFIPGTDILRIWLSGENPEDLRDIVNKVRKVFKKRAVDKREEERVGRVETLDKVIEKAEGVVEYHRKKKFTGDPGAWESAELAIRQRLAIEELGMVRHEKIALEADQRRHKALLEAQEEELAKVEKEKILPEVREEYLSTLPEVQKQQQEVMRLELQIKEYAKLVTPDSPRLREMKAELTAAQGQLKKAKESDISLKDVDEKIRKAMKLQRTMNVVRTKEKLDLLKGQYEAVDSAAKKLGRLADDVEGIRFKMEDTQAILKILRTEKARLEIEKLNDWKAIEDDQDAEVPKENQASLLKTGGIYSLVGLLLGCLAVSYLEARVHRVHEPADVQRGLGIQTLGLMPLLAKGRAEVYGRPLPTTESLSGIMFVDAVNSLCAKLLCDDRLSQPMVLMVTSASENEGKTLIATQLAAGMARSGKKTLLLDCDFRNSRCHQQLGVPEAPGLSEVLAGEVEVAAAMLSIPDSEAHILTAGKSNPQVIKALSNGKFAALIQRFRQEFDCIIIDSAPTLVVSDGLLIGKLTDGVLLVVRSLISKCPEVLEVYDQLTALNIPTLGAVINANPGQPWNSYVSK